MTCSLLGYIFHISQRQWTALRQNKPPTGTTYVKIAFIEQNLLLVYGLLLRRMVCTLLVFKLQFLRPHVLQGRPNWSLKIRWIRGEILKLRTENSFCLSGLSTESRFLISRLTSAFLNNHGMI